MYPKKIRPGNPRAIIQVLVFALVFLISISKWLAEKNIKIPFLPEVSLHAICPFGGVVSIYEFATAGAFIQKIHSSSFILMTLGLLVAILFGPLFCGYICPFGTFQEWVGKLGKKLFPKKFNLFIPRNIDRVLRYMRYVVLVLVLVQTAKAAKLLFQSVDPYYALFKFFTDEVAVSAYIILIAVFLLSLFVERPWCKYLCPYGALLGLSNLIRIFKIKRDPESCINCQKCDRACPMNIEVSNATVVINHQCISCHKCLSDAACPIDNTVMISAGKKAGPLTPPSSALFASIIIVIAGIVLTSLIGLWATEPSRIEKNLGRGRISASNDPADIRGSYTFSQISAYFGLPVEALSQAFSVDPSLSESFTCKELHDVFTNSTEEIGTESVKLFVAFYLELPFDLSEDIYLPNTAVKVLTESIDLSQDRLAYLEVHTVLYP